MDVIRKAARVILEILSLPSDRAASGDRGKTAVRLRMRLLLAKMDGRSACEPPGSRPCLPICRPRPHLFFAAVSFISLSMLGLSSAEAAAWRAGVGGYYYDEYYHWGSSCESSLREGAELYMSSKYPGYVWEANTFCQEGIGSVDIKVYYPQGGSGHIGGRALSMSAPAQLNEQFYEANEYLGNPNLTCPSSGTEKPIQIGSGNKFLEELVFRGGGEFPLEFKLFYNSRRYTWPEPGVKIILGMWSNSYGQKLIISGSQVQLLRPDGQKIYFEESGGEFFGKQRILPGRYLLGHLERLADGFRYTSPDGVQESYDASGRLTKIRNLRGGGTHTLAYSVDAISGALDIVVTHVERQETLTIHLERRWLRPDLGDTGPSWLVPTQVTSPKGHVHALEFGSATYSDNVVYHFPALTDITWPTGEKKVFGYTFSTTSSPLVSWASRTAVTQADSYDAGGARTHSAQYDYDASGHATVSALGIDDRSYAMTVSGYENDQTHTVTNIHGLSTSYTFNSVSSGINVRLTNVSGAALGNCVRSDAAYTYDWLGFLDTTTDPSGLVIDSDFYGNVDEPSLGLLDKVTYRAADQGTDRVIDYAWTPSRQLQQVVSPGLTVDITYENGRIASRTETDTSEDPVGYTRTHARSRRWSYHYTYHDGDSDGLHRIQQLVITGPRGDQTTYAYNAVGNVTSVRNAVGHIVRFKGYNQFGLPTSVVDPNGVITSLVYDLRGRLTKVTTEGDATRIAYNPQHQIKRIAYPDGTYLVYSYTDSGRLAQVRNEKNELVETSGLADVYTQIFTGNGVQHAAFHDLYDALGRLWKRYNVEGEAAPPLAEVNYDAAGNPNNFIDGNGGSIAQLFDPLGRLETITDYRHGGYITSFGYDVQDRLTQVTDADGVTTTYRYDGFGNLLQSSNANTGTTTYYYDDNGNVTSATDAAGVTVAYSYDRLGRLTFVDYPTQADVTYRYDQTVTEGMTNYGKGRLTAILSAGSYIYRIYDRKGELTTEIRKFGGLTYTTSYTYDGAGKLLSLTYPSGNTIDVSYVTGTVSDMTLRNTGALIVSDVKYKPFGPVRAFTYGNGLPFAASFDMHYRTNVLTSGGSLKLDHDYDSRGLLDLVKDLKGGPRREDFEYDPAERLQSATGTYGTESFTYTPGGDRWSSRFQDAGGNVSDDFYTYYTGSHRLEAVQGSQPRAFTYSETGNLETGDERVFTYNDSGRLTVVTSGGIALGRYAYNPLGQRQSKRVAGVMRHFVYGRNGELLWEGSPDGQWQRDYVYLDGKLIALADTTAVGVSLYYVHTDHLGMPEVISDGTGQTVWEALYRPFGQATIVSAGIENNVRFPGQYYDGETGLHYNYFRDYEPGTGRYIESDPIGLAGGLNTYAYALLNPIQYVDSSGLEVDISINRTTYNPGGSITGDITVVSDRVPNHYAGDFLEDYFAGDFHHKLPIRPGTYDAFVRHRRDQDRVELIVPEYTNIQVHRGNTRDDVMGCFLPGTKRTESYVEGSGDAMDEILSVIDADGSGIIRVTVFGSNVGALTNSSYGPFYQQRINAYGYQQ